MNRLCLPGSIRLSRLAGLCVAFSLAAIPSRADDRSDALIAKAREILKKSQAAAFDRTIIIEMDGKLAGRETAHVRLLKPGYWSLSRDREEPRRRVCDGKYVYSSWDKKKQYIKVDLLKPDVLFQDLGPVGGAFFGTSVILPNQSGKYLGKQDISGKSYEVVEVLGETPGGIPASQKLFFGASGLPMIREYRSEMEKGKEMMMREEISKIDLSAKLQPADFQFKLPAGYTILDASMKHP
jgi:hypothetical protein